METCGMRVGPAWRWIRVRVLSRRILGVQSEVSWTSELSESELRELSVVDGEGVVVSVERDDSCGYGVPAEGLPKDHWNLVGGLCHYP